MVKIRLQGEEEKKNNIYFEVDTTTPPIGEGGMGKVMKGVCVDIATNISRPVAIKFLYEDLPAHAIERARREASIRLRNDNLIEMLGFIETETKQGAAVRKHYHVVSELLHGISLSNIFDGKCTDSDGKENPFARKLLKEFQTDPVHFAKTIMLNVLSGLIALHDAGYVHRDIDPSNIMLTEDGHIKLIDFGIAKQVNKLTTNDRGLTTAGTFMGKAEYAAPELAIGDLKHQNQTTDIYAMGILLYQCIVGHVPFEGPSHTVLDKQLHKKIPLGLIKDKGMRKIIECATDKDQNVRYQTAAQMRVAIENLDGKKRQLKKSTKIAITAACAVIALIVIVLGVYSYHSKKVEQERIALEIKATNDSLRTATKELITAADKSLSIGDKHDEGYERHYIEAFKSYTEALAMSEQITEDRPDIKTVSLNRDKAKEALLKAKDELTAKAKDFEASDMPDIAKEFYNRVKNITEALKYNP